MELKETILLIKEKITYLDIDSLNISPYNKKYLKNYQQNITFYLDSYSELLLKAISKLDKPINQAVFLDYGGGSGLLSYIAVTLGFNKVIYNDLYEISVHDAKIIAQNLELKIDEYLIGDIEQVTTSLNKSKIYPDLICSFDVLEHIYDINNWFVNLKGFTHPFKLFFKTSANGNNPFINKRIKKMHIQAELYDRTIEEGWKSIDLHTSFLNERKKIITKHFPSLAQATIHKLAIHTRGLKEPDIKNEVSHFIKQGEIKYLISHPTNTCDPYTGNWTEKIIDPKIVCSFIKSLGFTCNVSNSHYSYSKKRILNIPKYLLNLMMRVLGKSNLFLSPSYTIEVENH